MSTASAASARFEPVGESWELRVEAPPALARFLAYKGSITVNGVSLTVNRVEDRADGCELSINLIPHTLQNTTLGAPRGGRRVNLEIDLIARYVERMLGGSSRRRGRPDTTLAAYNSPWPFPRFPSSSPSWPPAAW